MSLTNMSSTKAILATTADSARMEADASRVKIISILTAVFLPFAAVAVCLVLTVGSSKRITSDLVS
jgi:hypothetical protein